MMIMIVMTFREIKTFTIFSLNFFMLIRGTNYGHMMAISQILLKQYHIWDIFGLGLNSKIFLWKKQLNDRNHGQGTHSAKMGVWL